ncbi:MAG: SpoIIE family protein phosphatase [Ignavibacteriales bacterium]|nr:SpoIIE family protein phosphatase [Ignavibacteriales bacterium]
MNLNSLKINLNLIIWIISSLVVSAFIYRLLFFSSNSTLFFIVNDFIVFLLLVVLILFLIKSLGKKNPHPSALVLNIGIISAFVFLVMMFAENLLNIQIKNISSNLVHKGILENLLHTFYGLMYLGIAGYFFAAYKELYFYKQQNRKSTYFTIMSVFIALSALSNLFFNAEEYQFIYNTFFIISIILIVFNSIKISWIAFISKKEKISLLILSIIISALFILNLINNGKADFNGTVLMTFSPAIYQLFNLVLIYGAVYFLVLFFTTLFHIPTAEAYDRKANEVSSLQFFSKLITQVLDIEELAETITDITTKVSSADAAWIIVNENGDNKILSNKNIALVDADLINQYLLKSGICEKITETKICTLQKFENKSQLSEKFSSLAISPLRAYNEVKGYLIAARKNELIFYEEDKTAINTFSDYASIAIENSLLLEQSIEKERLEKELDVAREIQKKILPSKDPKFENLSVSSVFIPAFEVGGDYYDYFEIAKNKFAFIIADVSGKGISAAFIMAEVKGIFSSLSRMLESPKEILIKANEILQQTLNKKNFVSALYGIIDFDKEIIRFSRAGHCPAILVRDNSVEMFKPSGIGLGLTNNILFSNHLEEIKIDFKENDTIVFYTDGITEAKNKEFEDFGEQRFSEILIEHSNKSVNQIANEVIKDVTLFSRNHSQYDDITLVIFKWHKKNNIDGVKEWQSSTPQLKNKVL